MSCITGFMATTPATRRDARKLLVSPQRYARAEQEYDGEIYQIACELEVTVKVLEDYREWLRNQPSGASLEEV